MDDAYRDIVDLLATSRSFLIASHIDPDGDAIGCEMAMFSVLKRLGKSVKVVSDAPVPETFVFLKGADEVIPGGGPGLKPAEVGVVLDAGALDRLGSAEKIIRACGTVVNIDHHKSNTYFGRYNLVETGVGACGETLYRLIRKMGLEPTRDEAEALYVAILSDTGCFRFPTTTAETLRIGASLLEAGVEAYHAASEVFWKKSPAGLKLLSRALSTIEVTNGGSIATMEITNRMYDESGATPQDADGFATYPRSIRNVVVGVLIREVENGCFRVSLRSREGYAVSEVARSFGGGGHPTAAGFRICGDREEIKTRIRGALDGALLKSDSTPAS
jgi:phosphoesterase RecJ-like protein